MCSGCEFFVIVRGFRHPRDMGLEEIEDYLVMLANESRVPMSQKPSCELV